MRRWRLVLGGAEDGTGASLGGDDGRIDAALSALYDSDDADGDGRGSQALGRRRSGLGASAPQVARWLGDIRTFFPVSVVQVMQKDAIERLGLTRLLLEPEMLEAVEPDVHLVGTLLSLSRVIPEQARESARAVVRTVTRDLERRLAQRTRSAVAGALNRANRTSRPRRPADIDWDRTIRANLRNYQPSHRTIVPERLTGYARKQQAVARDVIICLDQSGSMASSVVYAGVFGAVLASIRSLRTSVVAFDTAVVDLTDQLSDPVDVLFGVQLGGGTDINRAIAYCQRLITRPASTIFILVSDLFEGGIRDEMLHRIADMTAAGTQVITLLALSDDGAPGYDHDNAAALAELGVPAFACTPDSFPDLMAAAIERRDIAEWAHRHPPTPTQPSTPTPPPTPTPLTPLPHWSLLPHWQLSPHWPAPSADHPTRLAYFAAFVHFQNSMDVAPYRLFGVGCHIHSKNCVHPAPSSGGIEGSWCVWCSGDAPGQQSAPHGTHPAGSWRLRRRTRPVVGAPGQRSARPASGRRFRGRARLATGASGLSRPARAGL
jgi:Mg-chelatase subunit ChlD